MTRLHLVAMLRLVARLGRVRHRAEKEGLQRTTCGRSLFEQVVEMFGACIKQGDMRRQ
jgi:DNA-binding phage protein